MFNSCTQHYMSNSPHRPAPASQGPSACPGRPGLPAHWTARAHGLGLVARAGWAGLVASGLGWAGLPSAAAARRFGLTFASPSQISIMRPRIRLTFFCAQSFLDSKLLKELFQ